MKEKQSNMYIYMHNFNY